MTLKQTLVATLAFLVVGASAISCGNSAKNLSLSPDGKSATANCYIVSEAGAYKFQTVKGNSNESVGSVVKAEVLWESFGTDEIPSVGDLVRNASYNDGYITFQTASTFREGNAVIAAKDAFGKILWSWHIWLTDQPQGQVYYNNAGTMMDRNLGATSATPGDVCAFGLLYQWGRKDPFLGASSISKDEDIAAKSTITWPSTVSSDSRNGTIEYATAHPTTLITYHGSDYEYSDWHYIADNTRWTTSDKTKSIYDPCPAGWRVPDGGDNGVWSKALGSSADFDDLSLYDSSNNGINFSGKFGAASTIWYPVLGYLEGIVNPDSVEGIQNVGYQVAYWSASPHSCCSCYRPRFSFSGDYFKVRPSSPESLARGQSVRCLQE